MYRRRVWGVASLVILAMLGCSCTRDPPPQVPDISNPPELTILFSEPYGQYRKPIWSPRGDQIVFLDAGIALVNLDDSSVTRLVEGESSEKAYRVLGMSWNPDGSEIIFSASQAATGEYSVYRLYVVDIASREISRLPDPEFLFGQPSWSPGRSKSGD